jgi:hypothetical protein
MSGVLDPVGVVGDANGELTRALCSHVLSVHDMSLCVRRDAVCSCAVYGTVNTTGNYGTCLAEYVLCCLDCSARSTSWHCVVTLWRR